MEKDKQKHVIIELMWLPKQYLLVAIVALILTVVFIILEQKVAASISLVTGFGMFVFSPSRYKKKRW